MLYFQFHISAVIWYLSLSFRLTSLSMAVSICVRAADGIVSFCDWSLIVCICCIFFIRSSVNGHLGCFSWGSWVLYLFMIFYFIKTLIHILTFMLTYILYLFMFIYFYLFYRHILKCFLYEKWKTLSCVWLCDPWTVACQAPLSMIFIQVGDLPNPGIKPRSPVLQADSLPPEPSRKPNVLNLVDSLCMCMWSCFSCVWLFSTLFRL